MDKTKQYFANILTVNEIRSLLFLEIVLGLVFSVVSLILFRFVTHAVLLNETVLFDRVISGIIISYRESWLTQVMLFFSLIGVDGIVFGSVIILIFLTLRKHHRESFVFSILLFMGIAVTVFLKLLYKIPRPTHLSLIYENSYSYPSGHALNSLLFYGVLSYFIYHFTKNKILSILASILAVFMILLISLSRIYLGVHRPTDIIAGFIVGFWLLVTTILIDKTVLFFKLIRENSKVMV